MDKNLFNNLKTVPNIAVDENQGVFYGLLELTQIQEHLLDSLIKFVKSNKRFFVLAGYAGTGKSTVLKHFIRRLYYKYSYNSLLTAPTHKAVGVISSGLNHPLISFRTIHSAMGLKMKLMENGTQIFTRDYYKGSLPPISFNEVIIVDEASMLSSKLAMGVKTKYQTIKGLYDYAVKENKKIIFVGDDFQNPPVNEDGNVAVPFQKEFIKDPLVEYYKLENVLRQALGSPIIRCSMGIRENKDNLFTLNEIARTDVDNNLNGVIAINGREKQETQRLLDLIDLYYNSKRYESDPNFIKIISWTRNAADKWNKVVRKMLYGKNAKKIEIGEKMVANNEICEFYGSSTDVLIRNNEEFEVISYETKTVQYVGNEIKCYVILTKLLENGMHETIHVVHEDSDQIYQQMIQEFVTNAEDSDANFEEKMSWWEKYHDAIKRFAQVGYAYAITSHKAQGSTYENAIVTGRNIQSNWRVGQRNMMFYTACTRPSKRLFITY